MDTKRIAGIQGLRGIAVTLVVAFHYFPSVVPFGWVGVDIFFVISGFVISRSLLLRAESGEIGARAFLSQRLRRLAPASLLVLLVTLLFSQLLFSEGLATKTLETGLAALLLVPNVYLSYSGTYAENILGNNPLLHFWSLGVEEQFYLLFALIALPLICRGKIAFLRNSSWMILVSSIALAMFTNWGGDSGNYFLLANRAWELIAGVLLALFLHEHMQLPQRLVKRISWLAVALGVGGFPLGLFGNTDFSLLIAMLGVTFAVAAILAIIHPNLLKTLLELRVLTKVGNISFSFYLWHWPVLVIGSEFFVEPGLFHKLIMLALSVGLSILSTNFVEQPFRNGFANSPITIPGILGVGAVIFATTLMFKFEVFETRKWNPLAISIPGYATGKETARQDSWSMVRAVYRNAGPDCREGEWSGWYQAANKKNLLIIGNSYSRDLYNVMASSERVTDKFNVGRVGCQLINVPWYPGLLESEAYTESDYIIISTRFSEEDFIALPEILDRFERDNKRIAVAATLPEVSLKSPENWMWIDRLVHENRGFWGDPVELAHQVNRRFFDEVSEVDRVVKDRLVSITAGRSVSVLDRFELACDKNKRECFALGPNLEKHYYDEGHLSLEGARARAQSVPDSTWEDFLKQ